MSKVIISKSKLDTLADTVAEKAGASAPLTLDEMVSEVTGLTKVEGSINITVNGSIDVTHYAEANVAVPEPEMQSKSVSFTPTKATQTQNITPDAGKDGLSSVNVTVNPIPSEYIIPSGTKQITDNGVGIDVAEFASVDVNVQGGGGGSAEPNDVEYIDYDGTIVYSYSAADFAQLTAHPANPSHDGLVAQGWNWTLTDAQAYVAEYGGLVIGQMYITESGDSEIDIELHDGRLRPYLSFAPKGTVEIDWGDGSSKDTLTGTSLTTRKSINHVYSAAGAYTITLHVVSGSFAFYGTNTYSLLNANSGTANANRVYSNSVQKIRIGTGVTDIGDYAFSSCGSLASISIPNGVTRIGTYTINYCYSLSSISIPSGVTSIGTYAFNYCYSIASISIPSGVTSIGAYAFNNCYTLASISIPSGVTSIGSNTFNGCYSLASINIPSGVTSIGTYAFNNCYTLASIGIPSGIMAISNSTFNGCYTLASINIPSGVTSVGDNAFNNCYGMAEYHFAPTTPPSLASTKIFNNIRDDCVIYVPSESLEAYKTASIWSTYVRYIRGE